VKRLTRVRYLGYGVRWLAAIARAPRIAQHAQRLQAEVDILAARLTEYESRLTGLGARSDSLRLNLRDEIWRRDQQRARDVAALRELKAQIASLSEPLEIRQGPQTEELEALISSKLNALNLTRSAHDKIMQALEANVFDLSANVADLREQVDRRISRLRKDLRLEENSIPPIISPTNLS
jgi:chromosome segregation ATPase